MSSDSDSSNVQSPQEVQQPQEIVKTYNFDYFANVPKRTPSHEQLYYNPNSNHFMGTDAYKSMTEAHDKMKKLFGFYETIEFVPGGGSLANERAILDLLKLKVHVRPTDRNVIMISSIEHSSISKYVTQSLNDKGYIIVVIPVTTCGIVNIVEYSRLVETYKDKVVLISCMYVNNELGIIQPIEELVKVAKYKCPTVIFHSDVSCCPSHFTSKPNAINMAGPTWPDIITFSAYKFGGPHYGVVAYNASIQLRQKYFGTPDVESICLIVCAFEQYLSEYDKSMQLNAEFKKILAKTLFDTFDEKSIEYINLDMGDATKCNIVPFIIPALKSSVIQKGLSAKGVAIGAGSACLSNEGSHTLKAMGYDSDISQKLVRLSFNVGDFDKTEWIESEVNPSWVINPSWVNLALFISNEIASTVQSNAFLNKNKDTVVKQNQQVAKVIMPSTREELAFNGRLDTPIKPHSIDIIALSYAELSLKGENQDSFIDKLCNEINNKMTGCGVGFKVKKARGMVHVKLNEPLNIVDDVATTQTILNKLKLVAGISNITPMTKIVVQTDVELCYEIANIYDKARNSTSDKSFKVRVNLAGGKYLSKGQKEWEYYVGRFIKDRFSDVVNLKHGAITLSLYHDGQHMYCYTDKIRGMGGLPVGSEGFILVLVSKCNYMRSMYSIFHMVKRGSVPIVLLDDENIELYELINNYVLSLTRLAKIYTIKMDENLVSTIVRYDMKHLIVEIGSYVDYVSYCLQSLKAFGSLVNANVFSLTMLMSTDDIKEEIDMITNKYDLVITKISADNNILLDGKGFLGQIIYGDVCAPPNNQSTHVNSQSSAMVLISGGIDSPVVSAKLTRIGIAHEYIHFISDIADEISKNKIINIVKKVTRSKAIIHFVNFGNLQKTIAEKYKEDYRVMLYKVFMVIISNDLSESRGCGFISMGNSWGQVASQTPENIYVTDVFSKLPILCPLIGCNKDEIIEDARKFDTYESSICNGNDCCTMYLPNNPVLRANIDYIARVVGEINYKDHVSFSIVEVN